MTYRTLIVGTDGSPTAELPVQHAGGLAGEDRARLVVVSAYQPHDPPENPDRVPEEVRWMLTDSAQAEGLCRPRA